MMSGSIRIGTIRGIPLYIHWTFLLLIGWLVLEPAFAHDPLAISEGLRSAGFVLAVFGCVLLHELGHALAARRFGIGTRDITLLPIGGIARLERMPDRPVQELLVALAGPAVNVVLALIIVPGVLAFRGTEAFTGAAGVAHHRAHFLASLGAVNIFLCIFNLIPAFPMDGGRVLRAILAMMMDRLTATQIAATIGRIIAVLFAIWGIYTRQFLLVLVAMFVFLGAGAEVQAEMIRSGRARPRPAPPVP